MSRNHHWTDGLDLGDITRQLASLRRDMTSMTHSATRHGSHAAHDMGDQLWHQGEVIARQIGRTAGKAGRAVKNDPVPAVVAVAGFALLLSLVLGRKRS